MTLVELLEKAQQFVDQYSTDPNRCCICGTDLTVQGHHIIPRHLNGPEDGPLAALCSVHHLNLHYITNGKEKPNYPSDLKGVSLFKYKLLAVFIIRAKLLAEQVDPSFVPRKIMVQVPHALLQRLHQRKQDLGYSNLQDYLTDVLVRDTLLL